MKSIHGVRPNVLFITLDQFRADHLGASGHPHAVTPNLDRLASQGVRFASHFANCAPCAPSRASLLTGLWQMNHRVTDNGAPVRDDLPMLPRKMREAGYDPVLFGYTDTALDPADLAEDDPRRTSYEQPMDGFDPVLLLDDQIQEWVDWLEGLGYELPVPGNNRSIYQPADVETPAGRGSTWAPTRYAAEHSESAFLTGRVIEWLSEPSRKDEPWFAHVSYLRPHPPFIAPAPYNDMFDPANMVEPVRAESREAEAALHPFVAAASALVPAPAQDLDQRQLQATYLGMIAEVDHQLGTLIDHLDELGHSENTVVIVTSDHGEQLGDHWLIQKLGFFDQSFRIPLIIRFPGLVDEPGRSFDAFTENVDVMPTILDLCGLEPSEWADGASLRSALESSDAEDGWWRSAVHFEYDFRMPTNSLIEGLFGLRQDECTIATIRDHDGKYVHFGSDFPSLFFDLRTDPGESVNLADDPEHTPRVLSYAQRLLNLRLQHTDPRYANTRATVDGTALRADPPRNSH
ncbi:MAG: alkaline phosphatase family protein [Microthrixaceae bacterium]